jgi:hypothetical protein
MMPKFRIRQEMEQMAGHDRKIAIGGMYFRPYDAQKDCIVARYSAADWSLIFPEMTEEELAEYSYCSNVVVLVWCDGDTDEAIGMLYLEEAHDDLGAVVFHGGTWNHNPAYYFKIYRSLVFLLNQLLIRSFKIRTTCSLNNAKADKFQQAIGFEEVERDECVIFKKFSVCKFNESIIVKRMLT